jgi:alanine-alpha-ketoisovalerate/valine-pyruvate aminotransferase
MATNTTQSMLHFPSEEAIIFYLKKHPLTSERTQPYLTDKKIIDAVAKFFANQDKAPKDVDVDVMSTMCDLNEKLKLPESVVKVINFKLTLALKDCANVQWIGSKNQQNIVSKL